MENYFAPCMDRRDVNQISALGLAHCGDAVLEVLVRTWLCTHGSVQAKDLHKKTVNFVSAPAQAKRMQALLPHLTEDELAVYKRGRNAHSHHGIPKNATHEEYSKATGMECLFGYLYLTGERERINQLFLLTMEDDNAL